jgi:phosphotriesterase-related protein
VAGLLMRSETGRTWTRADAAGWQFGEGAPGTTASYLGHWQDELRLDNYYDVVRNWFFYGEFRLNSIEDCIYEVERFKRAGGGCIVDATSVGLSRDPAGLREVSRATGVHIVMGGGYYEQAWHPPDMDELTEDELYRRIRRDIVEGVGDEGIGGGVRSGHIGEVGMSHPRSDNEDKALRAAVRAHIETGLAISIHPGKDPMGPITALDRLRELGANLPKIIFCHCDSRPLLPYPVGFAEELWRPLAEAGAYLQFDLFGWEDSTRQASTTDAVNDAGRVNMITEVAAAGFEDQILVSHDIVMKHWLSKYGGWGIEHIPRSVVPLMRRKGLSDDLIQKILVSNPAEALAVEAT